MLGLTSWAGGLDLGRNLGDWGQFRIGVSRALVDPEVAIGAPELDLADVDVSRGRAQLRIDTLDSATWPTTGSLMSVEVAGSAEVLGGVTDASQVALRADHAMVLGRTTVLPGVEWVQDLGRADVDQGMALGGLFRLSGLRPFERFGSKGLLIRLRTYRQMNERKFRVIQPGWYVGFSAEAGNVFDESQEIALDDLLVSGSLFAGLDTPIGPFLLGYGLTEGGRSRVYFSLGVGLWR